MHRIAPFLIALSLAACTAHREDTVTVTGAVQPGLCDPFDDNVGPTPTGAVDLKYDAAGSGCGIPGGGFRFTRTNLDTAWDYFCGFDSGTAGPGAFVWLCHEDNLVVRTNPCRHNANYSSTEESPGVPGPAWAPCWKANTTSKFRRLISGQTGSNMLADTGGGQTSILVTLGWLPDPPACPAAPNAHSYTQCGTTSDSGRTEYMLADSMGTRVTGTWPSGQTGAPCLGVGPNGSTAVIVYNCPVEPRSHYDY